MYYFDFTVIQLNCECGLCLWPRSLIQGFIHLVVFDMYSPMTLFKLVLKTILGVAKSGLRGHMRVKKMGLANTVLN